VQAFLGRFDAARGALVKILVVHTGPLFGHDETRLYAQRLCKELIVAGHTAELTTIPFSPAIAETVSQSIAYRLFDLRNGADVCIGTGPFSHALRHDNKRLWIFSQYGPFYENWNTPYGALASSRTILATRESVRAMDRAWISEASKVFEGSATLAKAILEQHGVQAPVLLQALLEDFESAPSSHGDHFLLDGALNLLFRRFKVVEGCSKAVAESLPTLTAAEN
jgi:hypothetical protein